MPQFRRASSARSSFLATFALAAAVLTGCEDVSSPSGVEPSAPRAGLYDGGTEFLPVDGGGSGGGGGGGTGPGYQTGGCGTATRLVVEAYGQTNPVKSGRLLGFSARLADANDCEFTPSSGFKWTVANSQVAYYEGSTTASTAELRAKMVGYTTFTVTHGSFSRTMTIQVIAGDPASIVVTPATLTLQPDGTAQLAGAVYDFGGNKLSTTITWESNNTGVTVTPNNTSGSTATVKAKTGLPVAPNPATVTANPGGGTAKVTVTVPECYCPPGVSCTCAPL